jgi:hypothetical protein
MPPASTPLVLSFAALAVAITVALPVMLHAADRRLGRPRARARRQALLAAAAAGGWLALTGVAAAAGWLSFSSRPPTMPLLFAAALALGLGLAVSPVGRRLSEGLPLAALVGVQGFRLPLELAMHRAAGEGLMAPQLSYAGRNLDIVTGVAAALLAGWLAVGRAPLWTVRAWNALGAALLANVVVLSLLSSPTPLRVFHWTPGNEWITRAPFVWLPSVLVTMALAGHVLVWRRLRLERRGLPTRTMSWTAELRSDRRGVPAGHGLTMGGSAGQRG